MPVGAVKHPDLKERKQVRASAENSFEEINQRSDVLVPALPLISCLRASVSPSLE